MNEMEFLEKEEKRLNDCLEMHENCAKLLKEDISKIQQIRERLQGQPDCEAAPGDSQYLLLRKRKFVPQGNPYHALCKKPERDIKRDIRTFPAE